VLELVRVLGPEIVPELLALADEPAEAEALGDAELVAEPTAEVLDEGEEELEASGVSEDDIVADNEGALELVEVGLRVPLLDGELDAAPEEDALGDMLTLLLAVEDGVCEPDQVLDCDGVEDGGGVPDDDVVLEGAHAPAGGRRL
jgi:hypothetical protein